MLLIWLILIPLYKFNYLYYRIIVLYNFSCSIKTKTIIDSPFYVVVLIVKYCIITNIYYESLNSYIFSVMNIFDKLAYECEMTEIYFGIIYYRALF